MGAGLGVGDGATDAEASNGGALGDDVWTAPTLGSGVVALVSPLATRPSSATPVMNRLPAARATTIDAASRCPIRRAAVPRRRRLRVIWPSSVAAIRGRAVRIVSMPLTHDVR